jgi:hypothetical protein
MLDICGLEIGYKTTLKFQTVRDESLERHRAIGIVVGNASIPAELGQARPRSGRREVGREAIGFKVHAGRHGVGPSLERSSEYPYAAAACRNICGGRQTIWTCPYNGDIYARLTGYSHFPTFGREDPLLVNTTPPSIPS